jgi:hypothetical protein
VPQQVWSSQTELEVRTRHARNPADFSFGHS